MKGSKRRRPDRGEDAWELRVDLGPDPVTRRRRQRSQLFRGTARAADTAVAALVADASKDRFGPGTEAPLRVLVAQWLELVADDLSPTTVRGYQSIIRSQIDPGIGHRPVGEITTPELDAFYRSLLATRAPATVRQTHAILRRAFRQAVRWGWLATNPAVEATPPRVRRAHLSIPSPTQVAALITAADEADPELACLLRLAVATGARRGELCGLRWSRVDLAGKAVLIDQAVVEVGGVVTEKDTKTHQARRVAIDAGTVAALRRQQVRTAELAMAAGGPRDSDPFVFAGRTDGGVPLSPDIVTGRFRRLAKVHAPGTRLHDLRHFAATQLLAAGVPVKTVSGRLGHGSAAMTLDVYAHHIGAADQAAADVLGDLLGS